MVLFSKTAAVGAAIITAVWASTASASTVASIDADGLFGFGSDGIFALAEASGSNNGLDASRLPSYVYSAALWVCGARPTVTTAVAVNTDGIGGGCDKTDDPFLAGSVNGGDLFGLLGDPGDVVAAIAGFPFDGTPVQIGPAYLSITAEDFQTDGKEFTALVGLYAGFSECSIICAEGQDRGPDGAFSLELRISEIPLPATLPLLLAGLGGLGLYRRRGKASAA